VADAFRGEWGRVVATLVRRTGDWDLAEECAQGAFEKALDRWPRDGVPDRPGAWLMTVAGNLAVDRLRRSTRESAKLKEIALLEMVQVNNGVADTDAGSDAKREGGAPDERLRLLFTCCHPALPVEARVALTLRTLCGLSTAEIARAFLVPEATMAKRLVRAKRKIVNAGIPYRVPSGAALAERINDVTCNLTLLTLHVTIGPCLRRRRRQQSSELKPTGLVFAPRDYALFRSGYPTCDRSSSFVRRISSRWPWPNRPTPLTTSSTLTQSLTTFSEARRDLDRSWRSRIPL